MNPKLIDIFAWFALIFYTASFIPQLFENMRLRSTRGLSSISLIAYFIGYSSQMYYIFCKDLILPYKVIVPIEFCFMLIIAIQRFRYEGFFFDMLFFYFIIGTSFSTLLIFPIAVLYPYEVGSICGWISLICFISHPIPQVIKNYREKSIEGFSFGFVTLLAIAVTFELFVAIFRNLPIPTMGTAIKGHFFYMIFCYQFFLYKKKPEIINQPPKPNHTEVIPNKSIERTIKLSASKFNNNIHKS
jgi:uncharacterized protein with PQ loop repeat